MKRIIVALFVAMIVLLPLQAFGDLQVSIFPRFSIESAVGDSIVSLTDNQRKHNMNVADGDSARMCLLISSGKTKWVEIDGYTMAIHSEKALVTFSSVSEHQVFELLDDEEAEFLFERFFIVMKFQHNVYFAWPIAFSPSLVESDGVFSYVGLAPFGAEAIEAMLKNGKRRFGEWIEVFYAEEKKE